MDFECFLKEKLKTVYRAHYAFWVYWWPLWRGIYSRKNIQQKWKQFGVVEEGQSFLDYGCGTGCFAIPAAKLVGRRGKVYALDCFARQLQIVEKKSKTERLDNIETILSDTRIGLPDESIDTIWMCDVLHEVKQKRALLEELYRVLRRTGALVIYDSMRKGVLVHTEDLFSLAKSEGKFIKFFKVL